MDRFTVEKKIYIKTSYPIAMMEHVKICIVARVAWLHILRREMQWKIDSFTHPTRFASDEKI